MKKIALSLAMGLLVVGGLAGCTPSTDGQEAYYEDQTADSIFGKLSDFSLSDPDNVKSGQTLTFKATPAEHYSIDKVVNNDKPCKLVKKNDDGSAVYRTKIVPGRNIIAGTYAVDKEVDWVDLCKIPIPDKVFNYVMSRERKSADDLDIDLRKSGIEQACAPNKYNDKGEKVKEPTTGKDSVFINYVDGDTTHVETYNLGYTVKIRYLSIDTPESTSEIERWGLSASNYSKYIYSGDEEYREKLAPTTDFTGVQAGATKIILMSQALTKAGEENIDFDPNNASFPNEHNDLNYGTTLKGKYASETDGNQRDLCYVWYSTAKNPTKDTFRCLNLEMVYQGFSDGIGSSTDTSMYMYKMLAGASNSAIANKRHKFGNIEDNNYFDYENPENEVQDLSILEIYDDLEFDPTDPLRFKASTSRFADKKTLYRVEGFVTRKVGEAFYMQSKTSYTEQEWKGTKAGRNGRPEAVGIYVFTYSQTLIRVGDKVSVIGALSEYGGTLQIQGISWNTLDQDPRRDTTIISRNHTITPVKMTGAEFNQYTLPSVLVDIVDNVYYYDFHSTYDGVMGSIGEGGSEEVNKYNDFYRFYNTSNAPFFYGMYGADNCKARDDEVKDTMDGLRYSNEVIRFKVDENVLVKYQSDYCYSYQFFTGGSYWYNPRGAKFASEVFSSTKTEEEIAATWNAHVDPDDPESRTWSEALPDYHSKEAGHESEYSPAFVGLFAANQKIFKRKAILKDSETQHGIICMSTGYESTSGKRKMTATICSSYYTEFTLVEVE